MLLLPMCGAKLGTFFGIGSLAWTQLGQLLVMWQEWSGMPEISDDDLKFWQELLGLHLFSGDVNTSLIDHKTSQNKQLFFNVFAWFQESPSTFTLASHLASCTGPPRYFFLDLIFVYFCMFLLLLMFPSLIHTYLLPYRQALFANIYELMWDDVHRVCNFIHKFMCAN